MFSVPVFARELDSRKEEVKNRVPSPRRILPDGVIRHAEEHKHILVFSPEEC